MATQPAKPVETKDSPVFQGGYTVKGGVNPETSQIATRPGKPAPMTPATASGQADATNGKGKAA